MSRPPVDVLAGGEVILSGPAVLWFAVVARRAVNSQRAAGMRSSSALGWADALAEAAERTMSTADIGRSAVPTVLDVRASGPVDPVTAPEAAMIMDRKPRNVTDLCARGSFGTAQRVHGRWQIERAEVLERVERTVG